MVKDMEFKTLLFLLEMLKHIFHYQVLKLVILVEKWDLILKIMGIFYFYLFNTKFFDFW